MVPGGPGEGDRACPEPVEGNLSNGQLWTLAMWVTADWTRDQEGSGVYLLPLANGRVLCYAERVWQPPAEPDEDEESV